MKNILLALFGFILLITPLSATAQQFGDFTYSSDGLGITITGYTGPGGAVSIPDIVPDPTFGDLPVTTVGNYAFQNKSSITSVSVPYSITSVGTLAFESCTSLLAIDVDAANGAYSSLDGVLFDKNQTVLIVFPPGKVGSYPIPASVSQIGDYAFLGSLYLTNVTISPGVISIATSAFDGCANLMAIDVDSANGAYSSLDGVLFNKSRITLIQCPRGKTGSYAIPGSVGSIGNFAFEARTRLTDLGVPNNVTNIGVSAFENCIGLTSVMIPGGINNIQTGAFESCTNLTNATILNGVRSIDYGAFQGCHNLTRVTIPGSVTSIGSQAFAGCGMVNLTISGSVTNIGGLAFAGLIAVFFAGNAPNFTPFPEDTLGNETVYFLPGTTGWGAYFGGVPTVLWNPQMQSSSVGPAGFAFNITGTADIPIVIEAATILDNSTWVPLQSLNLTNGTFYFSDPNWTNYPARFYRIRSP
jgi:hypothetical protein